MDEWKDSKLKVYTNYALDKLWLLLINTFKTDNISSKGVLFLVCVCAFILNTVW